MQHNTHNIEFEGFENKTERFIYRFMYSLSHFSSFYFKQIDPIGNIGAISLSEIINAKNTLTKLCLICELINNSFLINQIDDSLHFLFTVCDIETEGAIALGNALKT